MWYKLHFCTDVPMPPDGMGRKLLDVSRLSGLGWRPQVELVEGIKRTYAWYGSQVR